MHHKQTYLDMNVQYFAKVSPVISSPLIFPLLRSEVMAKFRLWCQLCLTPLLHKDRDTHTGSLIFASPIA